MPCVCVGRPKMANFCEGWPYVQGTRVTPVVPARITYMAIVAGSVRSFRGYEGRLAVIRQVDHCL